MKRIPFLLVPAFLLSFAVADDQIRDVQTTLKGQGFYYGETDGKENAETGAAIRRFQIRNGLKVTGKLNAETLQALGLGQKGTAPAAQPPAPAQVNPPPPAAKPPKVEEPPPLKRGKDILRNPEPEPEVSRSPQRIVPEDPAVIDPPRAVPAPVYTPFATLFRGTPYEDAPREVQLDTVRRAQSFMAERRYYRGALDGIPGPATSEAIFAYQEAYGLRRTGRLDLDTLADMRLLPRSSPARGPLRPFYNPNRQRDSSITWDFWIR
ncbi:MAG: peptidoglycan-binding domain-containing protein [Chthoniobacteraceae bacterium]